MNLEALTDIAVLRLDNLGDAILTSGLLTSLRATWPSSRITVFCGEASASFFVGCPAVNDTIALSRINPAMCNSSEAQAALRDFGNTFGGKYDLLINPRPSPDYYCAALYALHSQAPIRVAFRQKDIHPQFNPNGAYTLLADLPRPPEHPHAIMRHLLTKLEKPQPIAAPSIAVGGFARRRASELLRDRRCVAIGVGASLGYRIWPPENVAIVVDALARRGYTSVLIGSNQERGLAAAISKASPSNTLNVVGESSIEETAAIIARCDLYVGNDSGPKHIAAAVGTPVVEIVYFGDDTPGFEYDRGFLPVGVPFLQIAPSRSFTHEETLAGLAIRSISPETVLAAIDQLLRR